MGQRRHRTTTTKSHTLPSSPTHSTSSSEFEFTVPLSPRKSSADLRPADELFYKGKLLPLHLSPRLSMVRHLLLSSSSSSTSSSSDTTTTASRDSTASSSDSSRPSSATDDDLKSLTMHHHHNHPNKKPSKHNYFSLPKLSSVFRKTTTTPPPPPSAAKTVKEVIRKYFNKVKPLYEKLSNKTPEKYHHHHQKVSLSPSSSSSPPPPPPPEIHTSISHSFSGNLRYPRGRSCFSSCPSSIGSSPTHGKSGFGSGSGMCNSDASSMEELQNAIQGAILHCKNSMLQNKAMVSNEI